MRLSDLYDPHPDISGQPVTIELTEAEIGAVGIRLDESRWVSSRLPGIVYRVDPPRPEIKQRRHVHIAPERKRAAKGQQASWNDDATRHDRKSFNDRLASRREVQDLAREVLGLAADVVLEQVADAELMGRRLLLLEEAGPGQRPIVLASHKAKVMAELDRG